MHAVFVFQQMRSIKTVLSSASRHKAVIPAIGAPITVTQFPQLPLPVSPVDLTLFVVTGMTGIAHAILLNNHGFFQRMNGMFKLITAVGFLITHHAFPAELHLLRQAVKGLALFVGNVRRILGVIDGNVTR